LARAATSSVVTWEIPASLMAHAALFALVVLARCEAGKEPLFKAEDVMTVEMAGPVATATAMPQKAERAPDASRGAEKAVEAPPPNPSDMVYKTKDAPDVKGDANAERQRLIDEMKRRAMIEGLEDAPEGEVDRAPTGEGGEGGPAQSGINDPETAKWQRAVQKAVNANWHPLMTICQQDPSLVTKIKVEVNMGGEKSGAPQMVKESGNASLDASSMRALEATATLPPPPAKFAASDGLYATLNFSCKDAL
jgi:outer membrane biosynthesis protein TonB